jgi:3-dehydrotetronate 4-kinase
VRHAIVDAVADVDLENIGAACMSLPLVTGGSGVAMGLPANFVRTGRLKQRDGARPLAKAGGLAAVLAGSCSAATLAQVAAMRARAPAFALDPMALHADRAAAVAEVLAWAASRLERGPILIHSTAEPEAVSRAQAVLGREAAGALVEESIAAIARDLVARGVRRLVVAGGETSGAVVSALGVTALEIGPQIAPGVPATLSYGEPRLALALKSGNFGGPEFFTEALEALQ